MPALDALMIHNLSATLARLGVRDLAAVEFGTTPSGNPFAYVPECGLRLVCVGPIWEVA